MKFFVTVKDNSNPLDISWRHAVISGITCTTKPGDYRVNLYFEGVPSISIEFFRHDAPEVQRLLNFLTTDQTYSDVAVFIIGNNSITLHE